jgi:hypothetical protein
VEALTPRIPEFAHYYGDFIWDEELTGWIKSLFLFFDGIALALPPEMADRLIEANPVLAQPLAELGLLRNYDPFLRIKKSRTQFDEEFHQFLDKVWPIYQRLFRHGSLSEKDKRDYAAALETSTSDVREAFINQGLAAIRATQ